MGDPEQLDDVLKSVIERGASSPATAEEIAEFEADRGIQARYENLRRSGIDERLTKQGIELVVHGRHRTDDGESHELEHTAALSLVQTWLMSSRPMLVLLSPKPGVGKTLAAAWALSRHPGRYVRARDMCELRYGGRSDRALFHEHVRTELLVVDEIGLERTEEEAADVLGEIVDVRQRLPRRTLILGNLTAKQIVKRYDDRTLDRMGIESDAVGIALFRSVAGKSLRRTRRAW